MSEQVNTLHFTPLLRVTSVSRLTSRIELIVDDAILRIEVLGDDLMRLAISRTGKFDEQPTFAVVPGATVAQSGGFDVHETEQAVTIATSSMKMVIERDPFRIDAYRSDNSVIFETAMLEGEKCGAYAYLNDEFIVARTCRMEDAMLGLGEKTGHMNRMGRSFTLWNTDVLSPDASGVFTAGRDLSDPRSDSTSTEFDPYYVSIPFFQHLSHRSGHAAGFFIDNGYLGHFEFQHGSQYRFHFKGGQYTEYVFAGPSLPQIITKYTHVTGRMAPPPIWALGYHQCRWHAYTQQTMEGLGDHFVENDIPCDALWLDIEYMNGYRVFTWNGKAFPDPSGMIERFRKQGRRAISIIDPGVKVEPGYEVYDDGLKRDIFCRTDGGHIYAGQVWPGKTAFPDFATEEGRRWWGERNAAHVQSGLAGIWNDMNEPATGEIPDRAMRFDHGAQPHERYHNQYAMLMAMSTQEGLLTAMPELRTFILSRAGFAGIQRYAANWMGDNMSRWDHLWMSMPMAMGLGLSGLPFVGADIGGFAESTNPELFIRWMQCGVLTPFCRNHNNAGNTDQYPWSFGTAILDLVRAAIQLRYRLMPAIYTAFIQSSEDGLPVQRPLVLDNQADRTARDIEDEFMIGRHLLAAPVYKPGITARNVYLPQGTWHHWYTGQTLVGPRYITADTPMDYIPLYARGGSVIPLWPEAPRSTMDYQPQIMELHLFLPSAQETATFTSELQEDDGITFALRSGAYRRTRFEVRRDGSRLTLAANVSGDGYPEAARAAFRLTIHGGSVSNVRLNDHDVDLDHSGALTIPNLGEAFLVEMQIDD